MWSHYSDVIMGAIASQISSLTIVYSTVYSGADQRKHQSSASLTFVWGINRWPVNSPHKWPVTRKMSPSDDVIMKFVQLICRSCTRRCNLGVLPSNELQWPDYMRGHQDSNSSNDRQATYPIRSTAQLAHTYHWPVPCIDVPTSWNAHQLMARKVG